MGAPRMTAQTLRLLAVLLNDPTNEWYGFDLADRADLKTGTLYPILARLERAGWLKSYWEDVDPQVAQRPRRRLYVLTPTGQKLGGEELLSHLDRLTPTARRLRHGAPEAAPA